MRYLAFDLGARRSGVAAGEDVTGLAQPLQVLEVPAGEQLLQVLAALVREHAPDVIVVGLPLNMDGTEGPAAAEARRFAAALSARSGVPAELQDERLTSFEADQRMARSGRTHGQKRGLRDALAAAALLEEFMRRTRRGPDTSEAPPPPE